MLVVLIVFSIVVFLASIGMFLSWAGMVPASPIESARCNRKMGIYLLAILISAFVAGSAVSAL